MNIRQLPRLRLSVFSLIIFFALVALTAGTGAQFEPGEWYNAIAKPDWTPPGRIFGPVWGALYVAIAIAGWLAWRAVRRVSAPVIVIWLVQLLLNAAWSWIFFGLKRPGLALVDIVLLLGTIVAFIVTAWPRDRLAAILFIPYLLWVAFAMSLNYQIFILNT